MINFLLGLGIGYIFFKGDFSIEFYCDNEEYDDDEYYEDEDFWYKK